MRRCRKCGQEKSEYEFHKYGDGLQLNCKSCARTLAKDSYRRNKERVIERTKNQVKKKKEFIYSLKNKPCSDCGRVFPHWVMHFDHINSKVEGLSRMAANNRTYRKISAEAEKCEVVCVLCHRDRTIRRSKYFTVTSELEELARQWKEH